MAGRSLFTGLSSLLAEGRRLFGTDGVRGVANSELTPELALALGRAAGSVLEDGPVLIGRDTRRSGEMLAGSLQAGFHSAGVDTLDVGVATSGAISYLTSTTAAEMGAVVSASHNPAADNGIKLLTGGGTKLTDDEEDRIEALVRGQAALRSIPIGGRVGTRLPMADAQDRYLDWLVSAMPYSLHGIEVMIDCANGAAYQAAPLLFQRLRAEVSTIACEPDGTNINDGCGATHPETLARASQGRIGLAFDGDADRLIASDEDGRVVNGDVILAILAGHWKRNRRLSNDVVVVTVMSNLGFHKAMAAAGIEVVETRVGDRYVLEAMLARRAVLGGEQSGHIIFLDRARTGDGLLTAVRLLEVVAATGKRLAELAAEAMVEYPQVLRNVTVVRQTDLQSAAGLWEAVRDLETQLGEDGRVLVRMSGTEPVVRVMVEAPGKDEAVRYADRLAALARAELGEGS